jgi:hypothetical protein
MTPFHIFPFGIIAGVAAGVYYATEGNWQASCLGFALALSFVRRGT